MKAFFRGITKCEAEKSPDGGGGAFINVPKFLDVAHCGVHEARRGNPAGMLRRYASRNDSLFIKGCRD